MKDLSFLSINKHGELVELVELGPLTMEYCVRNIAEHSFYGILFNYDAPKSV